MTELDVLQEISAKLDILPIIQAGIQTLVFTSGVIISLMLVVLFSKAWGRNV